MSRSSENVLSFRESGTGPHVSPNTRGAWQRTHHALLRTGFYPATACTVLAVGTLASRSAWTGTAAYAFLLWNLFLAWVPWFLALPFAFSASRPPAVVSALLFIAWLLCLPNAPYLATDLLHLHPRSDVPLWFDAALLFFFAWTGCVLGFLSLDVMHHWVADRWGRLRGWSFVGAAALLTGFGIYLGRFRRWNSWDLVTQPRALLVDIVRQLIHPGFFFRTWVVTLLFAAFFVSAYGVVTLKRAPTQP